MIATPLNAPRNPSTLPDRRHPTELRRYRPPREDEIRYGDGCSRILAIPTLLVNHQLHSESLQAIDHLPTKHCYDLDVMVVNLRALWPTWLSITDPAGKVDRVKVTFRIFGAASKGRNPRGGFAGGDGGPAGMAWNLYSLLERSLKLGLPGYPRAKTIKGASVNVLELNVETIHGKLSQETKPAHTLTRLMHRQRTGEDGISSATLAEFINLYIGILLSMQKNTECYGAILLNKVGTIRVHWMGSFKTNGSWRKLWVALMMWINQNGRLKHTNVEPEPDYLLWKLRRKLSRGRSGS